MTNRIMELADAFAKAHLAIYKDDIQKEQDGIEEARAALLAEVGRVCKDAERLDWFDKQGYAYGFEDMHEGNQWEIKGPFVSIRCAIDTAMKEPS